MFSVKQTAELLGLHPETVRSLIRRGELKAVKIRPLAKRPTYRVSQDAIDGYLLMGQIDDLKPLPRQQQTQEPIPDLVSTW